MKKQNEIEENRLASENLQKRFNEYVASLNDEQKKQLEENFNNYRASLENITKQTKEALIKASETLGPLLSNAKERMPRYENFLQCNEYKGVDIDLILSKYRGSITTDNLCHICGIKPAAMSKYKSGKAVIPADKLIRLSEASDISMDLLLKQKERTLSNEFVDSEIKLTDLDLMTMSRSATNEVFKLSKNLPEDFTCVKAYRLNQELSLFGINVKPILIVNESFENPVIYGSEPFLAILKLDGHYCIRHIQRIGRNFMLQIDNKCTPVPIEKIKQNISAVVLKIIFDF